MPGMPGNKNGEKWSKERAIKLFEDAITIVEEDSDLMFFSELAREQNVYTDIYTYLPGERFTEVVELRSLKKQLKSIFKDRILRNGMLGKANPAVVIFIMKNDYDMADKKQMDVTSAGEKIESNVFLLPEIVDDDEEE
jgi:hypothetical protein